MTFRFFPPVAAMHRLAESGEAAHAAYKGGLDATQARQLQDWTESLLRRSSLAPAVEVDMDLAAASADEALFRSMDLNGDGAVSLEELHQALAELGVVGHAEADAQALLAAVDTNADGSISLAEFMAFQKRVGLVHAASAMDKATEDVLIDIEAVRQEESVAKEASSDEWSFSAADAVFRSSVPVANTGSGSYSAMHVWTSKDVPRGRSAVACGAFIEGGNSAGGGGRKGSSGSRSGSSGSSIDDVTIKPKNRATASFEAVPAEESRTLPFPGYASVVVDDVEADESVVDVDNVAESGDSFTIAVPGAPADDNLVKPDRAVGWRMQQAVHGFVRLFQESGVTEIEATWQLAMLPSAAQRLAVLDAAGQPLTALGSADQAVSLPRHGPCIVGAVRDRDCDLLLDMPTVSGRHARFEVIRLRGAGRSKCVVMDLGSTNGTWVNRAKITPFVEVPLYPGDVVCFAEPGIAFEVRTAEPAAAPKHGPAVSAALRVAQLLEAEAASRGVFAPPNAAEGAEAGAKARTLAMEGKYQAAYMLLLGGAMSHPNDAALWAQLAAMERQRARRSEQNSSEGTVRAFFRAAVERFEACEEVPVRRLGLSKVFSSWAQLEYDLRNDGPARILFQKAVRAAKSHPHGPDAASAAKLLFTWATRERKLGDDPLAARLCQEALDLEPRNTFALTLLGNIQADVGELNAARESFRRALDADPRFVSALQSWGRVEAAAGNMNGARRLFRRALRSHPTNCFVLQAWAVAEARIGQVDVARRLLEQCTMIDPGCRKAWHAWGKLEEAAGDIDRARELYQKVLKLKPKSVETLSALGHLELSAGDLAAAENALAAALEIDPRHAPSVQELAKVRRAQDRAAEAYRLEKKARRLNQDRLASISQVRSSKAPQQPGVPLN